MAFLSLNQEMMVLVLQFLDEENLRETLHKMEQETGIYFNLKYFEKQVLAGEWEECEKYLASFTNINDNGYSMKMIYEIRKQKYYEALDSNDKTRAIEILVNDLKIFSTYDQALYKQLTNLITLDNLRENIYLSKYQDVRTARILLMTELKRLINVNNRLNNKLKLPKLSESRLRHLINHGLNWQHVLCKNPQQSPDIATILTDHTCDQPNAANHQSLEVAPFLSAPVAPKANALPAWMVNGNPSSSSRPLSALTASTLPGPSNLANIPRHTIRTPITHSPISDQEIRRLLLPQTFEEAAPAARTVTPQQEPQLFHELPRVIVSNVCQQSAVTSMEFHPSIHTILAVGNANGEISLWDLRLRQRLMLKSFEIWNISNCSAEFQAQAADLKESPISVTRVTWSPHARFFGVAFSKHLIQLYTSYHVSKSLQKYLEIEAHDGRVNDIGFSFSKNQLCIVTCGDDKLIKVWDLKGHKIFTFEGHAAPVYSVLPHSKENLQYLFSTSVDGKIMAWVFDNKNFRVEYDTPGNCCTAMLYSADGTRLFSCGTNKEGDWFLVEWNDSEGSIKRTYSGFKKSFAGNVQFDTTKNRILAVGVDNQIKIWDMDNINLLTSTDAGGGLSSLPLVKFNNEGNLLAVTTEGGFKILSSADGFKSLNDAKREADIAIARSIENRRNLNEISKPWKVNEIVHHAQCRRVTMPESIGPSNNVCLLYTKPGTGLLALGSKGVLKMWKWSVTPSNHTGKATTSVNPEHSTPTKGIFMTNDVPNNKDAIPCLDISNNGTYGLAACGGIVSLFKMVSSYKVLHQFMSPPPAATCIAFIPQDNNIAAIGREDSVIHIFSIRHGELIAELKGHQKYITSIAFSLRQNIMVSAGADAQLISWNMNTWTMNKSASIQMRTGENAALSETKVQFHSNQELLLACHETQLVIYDASRMKPIIHWLPQDDDGLSACAISSATYSSNFKQIYATFSDGNIGVFDAGSLILRCRIAPSAYLYQTPSTSGNVYPLVVTANPDEPSQFAIALSDGTINVIEPKECETWW
ncbi:topless-related protein 2-like [Trifolium pratense]|nr:topless-related protein 2-like [Trifolium pratense]